MKQSPKAQAAIAKQIELARMHVLETALVMFVEEVLGRVPTDDEILDKSFHVSFSDTPLSTLVRDNVRFTQYFCWAKEHVLAYGFVDPKDPTALSVCRVPREEWPGALAAYTAQYQPKREDKP